MSKLKQLIGLQTSNLSVRELARALGLSIGAVAAKSGVQNTFTACLEFVTFSRSTSLSCPSERGNRPRVSIYGATNVPMTSQEAATARQRLGLSVEDLSAELGLTPDVVKGWESGLVRVPNRVAKDLQWRRALQDREEALLTSGLPDCEWMVAWEKEETPDDTKAHAAYMERADKHLKVCPVCNAREQFVAARFGEMPKPPLPAWMTALGWVAIRVEKLPEWARPGVWIGLAFGAYSMFRIIFFIPAMLRDPKIVITALTGLSASMAIGASLGLAYGAFRKAKSKLERRAA